MALLFFDGFEGLATSDTSVLRYDGALSAGSVQTAGGGLAPPSPNGRYFQISGGPDLTNAARKNFSDKTEVVVGFRTRFVPDSFGPPGPSAEAAFCRFIDFDGGLNTSQLTVTIMPDLKFRVRRGTHSGTILGTSAAAAISSVKGWWYVEIKAEFASSADVEIRVNGVAVLTLTGVDTTESGNNVCNAFGIVGGITGGSQGFDDLYILDTTGSAPYNDFLGDIRVIELLPNAAGDSTQWTPNAGANWDREDDVTQDGDTTYVSSNTDGQTDLYNLTLPDSAATTIRAAKFLATARKTDPGARDLEVLCRTGGTTYASSPSAMTEVYVEYTNTYTQNPNTTADWTISDLNDLQAGFRIPV